MERRRDSQAGLVPSSFRYAITRDGLHLAFGLSRIYARLLQPTWAALLAPAADLPPLLRHALVRLDAALADFLPAVGAPTPAALLRAA